MESTNHHLAELLKLPPAERLEAVDVLLDSLDSEGDDPDWEAAWSDELTRRLEGLYDGTRQPIDAESAFANAYARLDKLHD